MRDHSETEHKYNHVHSKSDCFCNVQHKEYAVIDDIYERMKTNAIKRRSRLMRKLYLQTWDYFVTFTYIIDDNDFNDETDW